MFGNLSYLESNLNIILKQTFQSQVPLDSKTVFLTCILWCLEDSMDIDECMIMKRANNMMVSSVKLLHTALGVTVDQGTQ